MADIAASVFEPVDVTSVGQTLNLGAGFGSVAIRNIGPNVVFFAPGVLGTAITATRGSGRYDLQVNEVVNLAGVNISSIGFRCAAAQTGAITVIAQRASPGNSII